MQLQLWITKFTVVQKKLGRNPRSDRDLCKKGNKKKEKSKKEIKIQIEMGKKVQIKKAK